MFCTFPSLQHTTLHKTTLFFMGVYLFVLNLPHLMSIRETSFLTALLIAVIMHVKEGTWEWTPLKVPFMFWIGIALVSLSVTNDIWYSLSEIRKEILYAILSFWLFYTMTRKRDDFVFLSYFLLFSATIVILQSNYHYFLLGHRFADLTHQGLLYGKATYYSIFMFISTVFCLVMTLMKDNGKTFRICALMLVPFSLFAQYFAEHRSGYLVIAVAILVALLIMIPKRFKLTGYQTVAASVALIIIVLLPVMIVIADKTSWNPQGFLHLYTHDSRWSIWSAATDTIIDSPLLGNGFGNKYFNVLALDGMNFYPHNLFLSYGVMMGAPGIIILIALFGKLARSLQTSLNKYYPSEYFGYLVGSAGIVILGGFVVHNLTDDAMVRHTGLFFWSIMGMVLGSCRNNVV